MSVPQGMEFVNNPCQIKYVDGVLVPATAPLFGGLLTGPILLAPILDVMRITGVRGVIAVFPAVAGRRVEQMTAGQPRRKVVILNLVATRTCGGLGVLAVFPALAGHRVEQMTAGQPRRKLVIPSLVRRHIRL